MIARLWVFLSLIASPAPGADGPVDFDRDIRPIFEARCVSCHGPEGRKGGLLLTSRRDALLPTDSGEPAIVPGDPKGSELVYRLESEDELDRMPPDGARLGASEVDRIRDWIARGAPWPGGGDEGLGHWAYEPPARPTLPEVDDPSWCRNAIDRFVLARLERAGLHPSPEADRETLIRRLSLDLTGLPPTPGEVDAFLGDARPGAYDRLVDRLLASPRYGERWATPWLDLARFADSNGFQRDGFRDVWPYRDWVIRAINEDRPFDEFTVDQVAGDLRPGATIDQRVATGFNRGNTVNVEAGVDQEENRINGVVDRVNTVATVWLGSTIACAQCHNHKYDPITQREYYRFFSYFNNSPVETMFRTEGDTAAIDFTGPTLELPLPPDLSARREELAEVRRRRAEEMESLADRLLADRRSWEEEVCADPDRMAGLPGPIRAILAIPESDRTEAQRTKIEEHLLSGHPEMEEARGALRELEARLEELEPPRSLVMVELEEPRPTFVMKRGNFLDPGPRVLPGVPEVLHPMPEGAPPDRLGLARWLVDPGNPLIGRVTVNRWWLAFFGRGLVTTPEDFGTQGAPPSHPGLLDWLAVEFVERGWSTKRVHRLIVSSSTYRQSSRITPELLERDPENALYARGARFRLDAETIRDNALAASGLLSEEMGGPPSYPPQPRDIWRVTGVVDNTYETSPGPDRYRRGVYTIWRRSAPYPSFVAFDATDRSQCLVQRSRTNTPLQALTLLNDPAYVEIARALAARVIADRPEDDLGGRLDHAFRLCLARTPTPAEREALAEVYHRQRGRYADDPASASRLVGLGSGDGEGVDVVEWAAWFGVANVLLNLDEMITRG